MEGGLLNPTVSPECVGTGKAGAMAGHMDYRTARSSGQQLLRITSEVKREDSDDEKEEDDGIKVRTWTREEKPGMQQVNVEI